MENNEIDFEEMSFGERCEEDQYNMLSQYFDDESSVFQDKLDMYRNEF